MSLFLLTVDLGIETVVMNDGEHGTLNYWNPFIEISKIHDEAFKMTDDKCLPSITFFPVLQIPLGIPI